MNEIEEAAAAHFKALQESKRSQEAKFDSAALLVAGGAFTVSAAFVPQLSGQLRCPGGLGVAWASWALCLVLSIGSFLFSAHCNAYIMQLLRNGERDLQSLKWPRALWIPRMNIAVYLLLISGFVAFGVFTFSNLNFRTESAAADRPEAADLRVGALIQNKQIYFQSTPQPETNHDR